MHTIFIKHSLPKYYHLEAVLRREGDSPGVQREAKAFRHHNDQSNERPRTVPDIIDNENSNSKERNVNMYGFTCNFEASASPWRPVLFRI
jgi:hypothetical protein